MNKLRSFIFKNFLIFAGLLVVSLSILDSLFDALVNTLDNQALMYLALVSYFLLQIIIFILYSILFYRRVNKSITIQSKKNLQEQNLLFANIAHDLKTPLTTIIGFSKALDDQVTTNPTEQAELLKIIHQKALLSNELLDLMFQYTKLNSDEFQLNLSETNLEKLLREIIAEHYDLFEEYQINLDLQLNPSQPVELLVDQIELKRAFANLIINACKHNPSGTTLKIELTNVEKHFYLKFIDNGAKIPPAMREKLFHPFVSANQQEREISGSGLGLAITKSILEKHGFTIVLNDAAGDFTKEFVIGIE
ncbi:signal transduction histidine kinase [Enterococcus sp. PF1-24]|uniref:sensor histidine kinase n=1 Tax=unclassified Enterococcus TaxID=2608891 RepID=UPI00247305F3|nr:MULTISPECIES: HAMP domain-containing sensor histidine kinase [unclassified Enterococcus]MDH6365330.1 signal transduction histidine kinase [Enterococcus sp. PFB1-1]MDH6402414.1 signal transduction histidine kinase [Enterococcus sp. PF1-24]